MYAPFLKRYKITICLHRLPKIRSMPQENYVKLTWQPDNASLKVKECMMAFENDIRQECALARSRPKAKNLSKYQFAYLQHLRQNKTIIVFMLDKNLGTVVLLQTTHIQLMLAEHLLDGKCTY